MAASTIYFNGRVIATPGSYTEVDASGLEQAGLGASGIVAILGTAEGGVPASAYAQGSELIGITTPERVRRTFRSGDLREACAMVFEPSNDPAITAGAQVVVPVKVNPATRSQADFPAGGTISTMRVTSRDYGAFTAQTNVAIANGTSSGKLITVQFEGSSEVFDNVTSGNIFTVNYVPPVAGGWTTMRLQVLSDRVRAYGTKARSTLIGEITLATVTTGPVVGVAGNAANHGKQLTVYGLSASGAPLVETQTLGAANVSFSSAFVTVQGARLSSAAAGGNVLVQNSAGSPATLITIPTGAVSRGLEALDAFFVGNSRLVLSADGAAVATMLLVGRNTAGAFQIEAVPLNGTTGVLTTNSWSGLDYLVVGALEAGRTLTVQGVTVEAPHSVQNTVQKVVDLFNARKSGSAGFTATLVTGVTTLHPQNLDLTSNVGDDCFNVADAVTANLYTIVETVNAGSALVTASRLTFAPKTYSLAFTPANATTYTMTINSLAVTHVSTTGTTTASVQAGLIAAVAAHPTVSRYAVCEAGAGDTVIVRIYTPDDYVVLGTAGLTSTLSQALSGAGQLPANTTANSPVFLVGGSEGTATFSDWQNALDLLKQRRVNTIVVLTGDPAIHAAVEAHCEYMCGVGRSERDACIGLSALDGNNAPLNTLPTKASIQTQIRALNTRHIRAFAQSIQRFNTAGELTTFHPWYLAVLAAGMQAGSAVGTSLTHKYVNVLGHAQNTGWNPVEDGEELILSGLCFIEEVSGIGRRFVRNVTTHLSSSNLAYTEASVNEAVNYATYELRNSLEFVVGQRGTRSLVNNAKAAAAAKLNQLLGEGIIVNWRGLSLSLTADVMEVSVEIAPVSPVNFVKTTLHLNTVTQS